MGLCISGIEILAQREREREGGRLLTCVSSMFTYSLSIEMQKAHVLLVGHTEKKKTIAIKLI